MKLWLLITTFLTAGVYLTSAYPARFHLQGDSFIYFAELPLEQLIDEAFESDESDEEENRIRDYEPTIQKAKQYIPPKKMAYASSEENEITDEAMTSMYYDVVKFYRHPHPEPPGYGFPFP